ncbi:MAG: signal peptidase II [Puniceicoccales bacterium]|jgi:signal peptidase II|nr:signal peptidase II [Puniceicoccales bacterium]
MKRNKFREYSIFYTVLLIVLTSDRITKFLADTCFVNKAITILPMCVFLSHTRNTGAAWSMLQGNGLLLGIIGIFVLITIFILRRHLNIKQRSNQVIYGMICAGTLGNVIDRLLHGHVIDFIDIRLGGFCWPMFNVADASICCGVFLCFLFTFFPRNKGEPKSTFY